LGGENHSVSGISQRQKIPPGPPLKKGGAQESPPFVKGDLAGFLGGELTPGQKSNPSPLQKEGEEPTGLARMLDRAAVRVCGLEPGLESGPEEETAGNENATKGKGG
jgi:hypothetical protein